MHAGYIKSSKKNRVQFFDDHSTRLSVGEKRVYAFDCNPSFDIPEIFMESWSKYQKEAVDMFNNFR